MMNDRIRTESARGPAAILATAGLILLFGACGDGSGPDVGPAIDVELAVGDAQVEQAQGGETLRLQFPESSDREYRVAVQSAARSEGATSMQLRVIAGGEGSGSISASRGRPTPEIYGHDLLRDQRGLELRHRITEAARSELLRRRAVPARPGLRTTTEIQAQVVPGTGEQIEFSYPVQDDFSVSCEEADATTITGEVQHVSDRIAFVEDTDVSDGFTELEYQTLGDEFDQFVFATDSAYFGGPSDIDHNERVIVLFTPQVNLLTEEGSDTFVGGFFIPVDLADSGDPEGDGTDASGVCATSNEAEILYLQAPDPTGEFNNEVSTERALENARSVSSHEFQHLLNAGQRLIHGNGGFDDLEELWLNEGLSHVAEEVVGIDLEGLALRDNLTFADAVSDQQAADIFNTFHISNFVRLAEYMGQPNETAAIAAMEDPGGFESLRMRGFAWIFSRWLGDHHAPDGDGAVPGSQEEQLFRELASGGPNHLQGIANVERAVRVVSGQERSWQELVADFSAALAVDDAVGGLPQRTTLRTWDLPDLFLGLHENVETDAANNPFAQEHPLDVTDNAFTNATYDMDVEAGTARYFTFDSGGSQPSLTLELTDQAGNPLTSSASAQVTVVRIR